MKRLWLAGLCLVTCLAQAGVGPIPAQGQVEILFSPHDPVEARLIELIDGAKRTIHVQMYVFTRKSLAHALVRARARGVEVRVMADARQNQRGRNALPILLSANIPVALEIDYQASHNKLMLIDVAMRHSRVVTGSYNYSWSAANKNAENVVIFHDNRPVADAYLANWERHYRAATPVKRLPVRLVE